MLDGKAILVTGGTGSFGKKFIRTILEKYTPKRIIVYSRDELKQFEMQQSLRHPRIMRYFIGDVRDLERLKRAMRGVDIVVHAAALKQVPAAEYNPFECIKTNIIGGQNVIEAAMDQGVSRIIALSTDKAAAPINLYGATKLCSDKLFVAANNFRGDLDFRSSVVRYGNVMGSRGSVIPFFERMKEEGEIPITDSRMTRFNITLEQGVEFTLACLERMWGGEIFVPKIPSYNIMDVAEAVAKNVPTRVVGVRPGEKLHEEMFTRTDALITVEFETYYVILPSIRTWNVDDFISSSSDKPGKLLTEEFSYNSKDNREFLSIDELKYLIDNQLE